MKRSVGIGILLSIITCGIYSLYWMYAITEDMAELSEDRSMSGGIAVLLAIVTCGLYTIYWAYKIGKLAKEAEIRKGIAHPSDDSVLYVVLTIFALALIVFAIAQSKINSLVDYDGKNTVIM